LDLGITINGVALTPGEAVTAATLSSAGLRKLPIWKRFQRKVEGGCSHWEARDPHVLCFGGAMEIYPCKHAYLDPDRRWRTTCEVVLRHERLESAEMRILEGTYAASNQFERFVDIASGQLGDPVQRLPLEVTWAAGGTRVVASIDRDLFNATFRIEHAANGAARAAAQG